MNTVLAALLLFGAVDVKTAQKGDLYDDSVVVTNVNEAAFVKWGTTSGKTLQITGGYGTMSSSVGGVKLVGSTLQMTGSAMYPAVTRFTAKSGSLQGGYEVFESGTGLYFPKNADMAAASVYGLQASYESLDERLTRKFGGIFALDTDNNGDKTAFRIGSRAAGTYVGPYSSIFGYLNEASAQGALAGGYESAAGGVYDFAWGRSARASAGYATALGFRPNATNETAFVWQGSALYGEGLYGSHGKGTFNVNPVNGYSGFYVGSQSLADKFAGYLPMTGTPPGTGLTGNIHFYDRGVNRGEIGVNQVGTLAVASWTNLIEFAAEVGGLTRSSELHPDGTRILTQAYAKDAYPILTNAYTKGEVDSGFVPLSGTAEGKPITGSIAFRKPGSSVENVLGFAVNDALYLQSGTNTVIFANTVAGGANLDSSLVPDGSRILTQSYVKDAYPIVTNVYTKAEVDAKVGQGGGGSSGHIVTTNGLSAIYADGSWVTRTNATAGVAVTNTICTVSNVVTTVNEVKRKFYDAPLQVEWRFEAVNGEFMMIATTNVNTEVIQ